MSETPEEQSNPYVIALVVLAGTATFFGLVMMLATEPGYGEVISPAQLVGTVLFGVGLLTGLAWLSVSAVQWRPSVEQRSTPPLKHHV